MATVIIRLPRAVAEDPTRAGLCECPHAAFDHQPGRCPYTADAVTACERLICGDCWVAVCPFCGAVCDWLDDGTNTHHRPLRTRPLEWDLDLDLADLDEEDLEDRPTR